MDDAGADVPGFASVNRLTWLSAFQYSEIALQQVRGVKAGMCMKSAIHIRLHLDKHDHCFVAAIWDVKPFQNRPLDGFRHDRPREIAVCLASSTSLSEMPRKDRTRQ